MNRTARGFLADSFKPSAKQADLPLNVVEVEPQ